MPIAAKFPAAALTLACRECGKEIKRGERRHGRVCASCRAVYMRTYHVGRSVTRREDNLRRYYGLSLSDVRALSLAQEGCCAVCATPLQSGNGRHGLNVDHDHRSGVVRGLLCGFCNRAIGLLRDDPVLLRAAAAYLERVAERSA